MRFQDRFGWVKVQISLYMGGRCWLPECHHFFPVFCVEFLTRFPLFSDVSVESGHDSSFRKDGGFQIYRADYFEYIGPNPILCRIYWAKAISELYLQPFLLQNIQRMWASARFHSVYTYRHGYFVQYVERITSYNPENGCTVLRLTVTECPKDRQLSVDVEAVSCRNP